VGIEVQDQKAAGKRKNPDHVHMSAESAHDSKSLVKYFP
jgi:hypothetical protein